MYFLNDAVLKNIKYYYFLKTYNKIVIVISIRRKS